MLKMSRTWPQWAKCLVCWDDSINPFEYYGNRELVVLPCFHVVCSNDCFEKTFRVSDDLGASDGNKKQSRQSCPCCSRVISVTMETKFTKMRALDFVALEDPSITPPQPKICTLCIRKGAAIGFCAECDKFLCADCLDHHSFAIQTSSHITSQLSNGFNLFSQTGNLPESKCKIHSEQAYNGYCKNCDVPVCKECRSSHTQCDICSLDDSLGVMAKNMEDYSGEMRNVLTDLKKLESQVGDKIQSLLTTEKDCLLKEAQEKFSTLLTKLYAREEELRSEIRTLSEESARVLRLKDVECKRKTRSIFQYDQFLNSLIARATKADSDFVAQDGWLVAYRLAKKYHAEQIRVISKFNSDYFEMDSHFRMDETGFQILEKEIPQFCKISYLPSVNGKRAPPILENNTETTGIIEQTKKMKNNIEKMSNISISNPITIPETIPVIVQKETEKGNNIITLSNKIKETPVTEPPIATATKKLRTYSPTKIVTINPRQQPILQQRQSLTNRNVATETETNGSSEVILKMNSHQLRKQRDYAVKRTGGGFQPKFLTEGDPLGGLDNLENDELDELIEPDVAVEEDVAAESMEDVEEEEETQEINLDSDGRNFAMETTNDDSEEELERDPLGDVDLVMVSQPSIAAIKSVASPSQPKMVNPTSTRTFAKRSALKLPQVTTQTQTPMATIPQIPLPQIPLPQISVPQIPLPKKFKVEVPSPPSSVHNSPSITTEIDMTQSSFSTEQDNQVVTRFSAHPPLPRGYIREITPNGTMYQAGSLKRLYNKYDLAHYLFKTKKFKLPDGFDFESGTIIQPQMMQLSSELELMAEAFRENGTEQQLLPRPQTPPPPPVRKQARKEKLVVNQLDAGLSFENDTVERKSPSKERRSLPIKGRNGTKSTSDKKSIWRTSGKREIKRKTLDPSFITPADSIKQIRLKPTTPPKLPKLKKKRGRKRVSLDPLKTSEESDHDDYCGICRDGGGDLICCDSCPKIFHPMCHIPPLAGIPDGTFLCNICRPRLDGCDPEKQPEKHIRDELVGGIHANSGEFYKACKFLSEVFQCENEFDMRVILDKVKEEYDDESESELLTLRKRLVENDPTKFEDANEMLVELDRIIQTYTDTLRPRKIPLELDRLKRFRFKFGEVMKEYYPEFKRIKSV